MSLDFLYLLDVDGLFLGLGNARIDTGEGIVLRSESLFHRLIVDGTQVAHKKRGGIRVSSRFFQIVLVTLHPSGVDIIEGEQTTLEEPVETVE